MVYWKILRYGLYIYILYIYIYMWYMYICLYMVYIYGLYIHVNTQMDDLGVPNLWKAPYSGVGQPSEPLSLAG